MEATESEVGGEGTITDLPRRVCGQHGAAPHDHADVALGVLEGVVKAPSLSLRLRMLRRQATYRLLEEVRPRDGTLKLASGVYVAGG